MMQAPTLKLVKTSFTCSRNLGVFAPAMQKAQDPIQKLFIDKIREFKSKSTGGKLVEPSPELQKEYNTNKERVYKQFGETPGQDYSKLPAFNFEEVPIEEPHISRK